MLGVGGSVWKRRMKTDLNVYIFPGDHGGCAFYRMLEPVRATTEYGINSTVTTDIPVDGYVNDDGSFDIQNVDFDADVMVIQRPLLRAMVDLIKACQKKGIACVVELDDDFEAIHKGNQAYRAVNPEYSPASNWHWLKECCEIADLVTVSTPNLARRYASHGRGVVLRNCIPASELSRPKIPAEDLRLGWSGTLQNHPEDLHVVGSQINAVLNSGAGDSGLWIVGDGKDVAEALYLTDHNEVHATGWVERKDYFATINSHIDVGMVPLLLDIFNTSKSYLKSLEFSSQGIPNVVSPTEENVRLGEITGNPVAYKQKDWQKHLKPLLANRDLWLERSHAVRESVRPLTYENHAGDWIEAWNKAIANRFYAKKF